MCPDCRRAGLRLVRGRCRTCYEHARRQAAAAGQPFPLAVAPLCVECEQPVVGKLRGGRCNNCYQRAWQAARRQDATWEPMSDYIPADLADAVGCPVAVVEGWMQAGVLPVAPDGSLSEAGIARFLRAYPGLWRCYPCPIESSAWRRGLLLDVAPPPRAMHTGRRAA